MKLGQARVSTIAPVQRRILLEPGGWPRSAKCSSAVPEAQPTGRGKVCKGPRQDVRCLHRDDLAAADSRCLSRFSVPLLPKPQLSFERCRNISLEAKQESGGIRFDKTFWSKIESKVAVWLADVCGDRHLNKLLVPRAEDAILHRLRI